MNKYFGQVNFTIEAETEKAAQDVQLYIRDLVYGTVIEHAGAVIDASADEPVEFDEFGHAG